MAGTATVLDALDRDLMILQLTERIVAARAVPVDDVYSCPYCRKSLVKETSLKVFCGPDCHDDFWSAMNNYKVHRRLAVRRRERCNA